MIRIDACLDEAGLLLSCQVSGHAHAGPRGGDVVCAAVSILTRTAFRTFSGREGIILRGGAPERGVFLMETDYSGKSRDFFSGAGAFLIEGFSSVAELYPEFCTLNIHRERRK
ncbi:MAG: ribosomal-processing cysteine protease Prp [Spirochaetaceae bacterium]|nr:ribosomal-processing cysteine protease Prp [Spirochaetaceae bacterium]